MRVKTILVPFRPDSRCARNVALSRGSLDSGPGLIPPGGRASLPAVQTSEKGTEVVLRVRGLHRFYGRWKRKYMPGRLGNRYLNTNTNRNNRRSAFDSLQGIN